MGVLTMHDYASTVRHESTTTPGVSFTLRVMTERLALRLRRELAKVDTELRQLMAETADLIEQAAKRTGSDARELPVSAFTSAERVRYEDLRQRIALLRDAEVTPKYIEALFCGIEGVMIDGDGEIECLADLPNRDLYREIADAATAAAEGLPETRRGNSGSPSTSGAAEGERTSATTAAGAAPENGTGSSGATVG